MLKKLLATFALLPILGFPSVVHAEDSVVVCPQPYGGGVVCGVHTPVATGTGENLLLIGALLLVSSLVFLFLSKRFKTISV
jgi:hypothetical protein